MEGREEEVRAQKENKKKGVLRKLKEVKEVREYMERKTKEMSDNIFVLSQEVKEASERGNKVMKGKNQKIKELKEKMKKWEKERRKAEEFRKTVFVTKMMEVVRDGKEATNGMKSRYYDVAM